MPWLDQARQLLRKARQDAVIVERAVDDAEISDEIVGFHTQQAAEKCFKAVLCLHEVIYRRTHDLQELHDLMADNGIVIPDAILPLLDWSPFAVIYRYEDWIEPDPVNRREAGRLVQLAVMWAANFLQEAIAPHQDQV